MKTKPNILFLLADDMGYGDFGFLNGGLSRTPALAIIPAPAENSKQKLVLDVTEPVKRQVEAGRDYLFFRVRIPRGCTFTDGQLRYSVFSGAKDSESVPRLKFILAGS